MFYYKSIHHQSRFYSATHFHKDPFFFLCRMFLHTFFLSFFNLAPFISHIDTFSQGNVIFDVLESHAFKNIAHSGSLKLFVFVYLHICVIVYLCILHLIHGNVIFNILESNTFQKYSTCWVLSLSLSL